MPLITEVLKENLILTLIILKNFQKIIYVSVENFPNFNDPWDMLKYQRNSSNKFLNNLDKNDYVIVSDVDEIPNPSKILEFINSDNNIGVFEQLMFYYNPTYLMKHLLLW